MIKRYRKTTRYNRAAAGVMENGVHKTIHGLKAYYVDLVQVIN